ncbi:MAG: hypothetical protein RLY20_483 [Verrucomicrobiota bacterium]|jgi:prepilin-type N-terminal cleavage/methylation domain-containing protein
MKLNTHSQNGNRNGFNGGFTLVEIMIVVALIGLLAAISIPNFIRARKNSKVTACINNLRVIDTAIQELKLERPSAPVIEDNIKPFIGRGSGGTMPACPAGGTYGDFDTFVTCSVQEPGYQHTLPN